MLQCISIFQIVTNTAMYSFAVFVGLLVLKWLIGWLFFHDKSMFWYLDIIFLTLHFLLLHVYMLKLYLKNALIYFAFVSTMDC